MRRPLQLLLIPVTLAAVGLPSRAGAQAAPKAPPKPVQGTGEAWQIVTPVQSSLVLGRDGSVIGMVGQVRRGVDAGLP